MGERAARLLAVPADGVAGVPRAELIGDNESFLEHYRGILAYGTDTSNPLELARPKRLFHAEGKLLASTRRTLTACLDLTAQGKWYTGEED